MATGLLALITGTATRLARFLAAEEKTYVAEIVLGQVSDTYDAEGEVESTGIAPPEDTTALLKALDGFRGRFLQTPPPVSAKKVNGVAAYKLARKKIEVELRPVEVEVKQLDVLAIERSKLEVRVTCSAGTYIRGIAHDLGRLLGCGGLLGKLRRTAIGEFRIEQARTLDELGELAAAGRLADAVVPSIRLLPEIPCEYFDAAMEAQIRQGRDFRTSPFVVRPGAPHVKAVSQSGELIAIGDLKMPNVYHPGTVF